MGFQYTFFDQAGVDFVTEAFAAARFASLRDIREVRLVLDSRPNFELLMPTGVERWELTEADILDRKRGEDYKIFLHNAMLDESCLEHDPVEDWHIRADQIPYALERSTVRKAGKEYSPDTRLLIYLNINEYRIRQQEIEDCMLKATG